MLNVSVEDQSIHLRAQTDNMSSCPTVTPDQRETKERGRKDSTSGSHDIGSL